MTYFVNVILVSVFICSCVKGGAGQGAEVKGSDNAEQFALLCRIYNVAKNPPIDHVDLQDPNRIVKEIDAINASFAEEKQFNETENVGNSSDAQAKPTITREAAVAQSILWRITKKAHTIVEEIKKINVTRDIEKVKGEFDQVIFGDVGNESNLCQGALKGAEDRGVACGKPGLPSKGTSAGNNLVVDFLCLCSQRLKNGEGIQDACRVKVGSKSEKHSWGATAPSGSSSMWASIKKECVSLMHQHPKSTEEGHEALGDFLKHLKLGGVYRWGSTVKVDGSGRQAGMLGTGAGPEEKNGADLTCDGSKGYAKGGGTKTGGICVYYGQEPEWKSIPWLQKLKNALAMVESANNQTATIQRDIEKLHMLLHRAEQIYETTKVIAEIQNPVIPTNLQTTAKRLTAYNAAWRHHPSILLPRVLLFL